MPGRRAWATPSKNFLLWNFWKVNLRLYFFWPNNTCVRWFSADFEPSDNHEFDTRKEHRQVLQNAEEGQKQRTQSHLCRGSAIFFFKYIMTLIQLCGRFCETWISCTKNVCNLLEWFLKLQFGKENPKLALMRETNQLIAYHSPNNIHQLEGHVKVLFFYISKNNNILSYSKSPSFW